MDSPTATDCNAARLRCATPDGVRPRRFEADFTGGALTADGGALLMGLANQSVGLFRRVAACFSDHRDAAYVVHEVETLVGQRILGLTLGYEDLNDHDALRKDPLLGAVLGRLEKRRDDCEPLAGKSTLNRLELAAAARLDRKHRKVVADFGRFDALLAELFAERFRAPPKELVLDLDATDVPLHGGQEGRFYHGYYREYCYLPLLVFCGAEPLLVRLRSAAVDAAAGVERDLDALADRLRARWPDARLILRTDSGYCREEILAWCEGREGVDYVIGLAKNARLKRMIEGELADARQSARETGEAARRFADFRYATLDSWTRERRVVAKAEALPGTGVAGAKDNPRFVVTSLPAETHPARALYEEFYCARGDAENRVKEHKLDLFSARCSCNLFDANTLRLYFSTFALILFNRLRDALARTADKLASAYPGTLRLRLLKIGARVRVSARRIHVAMAGGCPDKAAFAAAWRALVPT